MATGNLLWNRTATHVGGDGVVYVSQSYPNEWTDTDGSTRIYLPLGIYNRDGLTIPNVSHEVIQCLSDDRDGAVDEVLRGGTVNWSVNFQELGHMHEAILTGFAPEDISSYDDSNDIFSLAFGGTDNARAEYYVKIEIPSMRVASKNKTYLFYKVKIAVDSSCQADYQRGKYTDITVNFMAEYNESDEKVFDIQNDDKYTALELTEDGGGGDKYTITDSSADGFADTATGQFQVKSWPSWTYRAVDAIRGFPVKCLTATETANEGKIRFIYTCDPITDNDLQVTHAFPADITDGDTFEVIYGASS